MEKINSALKNIGLTDTETKIYLTGLNFTSIGVRELERQTRIKRTTIYHAINTLMSKGLVAKKEMGSKLLFSMTNPQNIDRLIETKISNLKKQQDSFANLIPLLEGRQKKQSQDIVVSHYEGIEGIKLVVEEALYCKSKHWDIISPEKNFFSEFDKEYAQYYVQTRIKKNITARSLWEKEANKRALSKNEIKNRQPRYLPEIMVGKFNSVIILFDDKTAFISSMNELTAVLIQSQDMHDMQTAMFEGLWINSRKYEE